MLREVQQHMGEMRQQHAAALDAAEAARRSAEEDARQRQEALQRAVSAAAGGDNVLLAVGAGGGSSSAALALAGTSPGAPPGQLSLSELYSRYAEASDALRLERQERRQVQAYLDAIMAELETKAPLIAEQRKE